MSQLLKYPRTFHIEGSKLQPGDDGMGDYPFSKIKNKHLVVEEKMDGANCAISISQDGRLLLQSRGHYLTGGPREKHFDKFKTWANTHINELRRVLTPRYIMYGEWLYAKHTIFYTDLPSYFMEFDVFDRRDNVFLDTKRRSELLKELPFISSVKVLKEGMFQNIEELTNLIGKSYFISDNKNEILKNKSESQNLNFEIIERETDSSNLMEGLYIKVEENGIVKGRFKYVRHDFLTSVVESNSHWLDRPIIPNKLEDSIKTFF